MIPRIINLPAKHSYFLFGPRQCGKSTLVRSRLPERSWEINLLENATHLKYLKTPSQFLSDARYQIQKKGVRLIFVDEVQKIPSLLDEVHLLIEETRCQFVLTGSSARKLKRGAANLLAGRALQRKLYPFIYAEIADACTLDSILRFGTLPAIFDEEDRLKIEILKSYTQTYLREEIQAEGLVRDLGGFSRFLDIAVASFGEITNYSNIGRECGVSPKTAESYYEILEDTLVGTRLYGWDKSARKQLTFRPKFYFFDNGVANAANNTLKEPPNEFLRGRLFEQWLINEIRANLDYAQSELRPYFWRTNNQAEVDLLLARDQKIFAAIEFKLSANVRPAHLTGMKSFHEEHPKVPCYVVSNASAPYEIGFAEVLPWREFLGETLPKIVG